MSEHDNTVPSQHDQLGDAERHDSSEGIYVPGEVPYVFPHPQWTVGVVLILAAGSLFLGVFGHPVWFLIGGPFIATFFVWLVVRVTQWRRSSVSDDDGRQPED